MAVVQSLSHVQLFATLWTVTRQAALSFTVSQDLLKPMSIELAMPSNHLIHCHLPSSALNLSQHQDFQRVDSASGGHSIGAVVSVLPMNIQD